MKIKYSILIILLFFLIGCANQKIRVGRTFDIIGPDGPPMYWIDNDLIKIHKNLETNIHIFIFEKENKIKIRLGVGARLGVEKKNKRFYRFISWWIIIDCRRCRYSWAYRFTYLWNFARRNKI